MSPTPSIKMLIITILALLTTSTLSQYIPPRREKGPSIIPAPIPTPTPTPKQCHFHIRLFQRCNRDDPQTPHIDTYATFTNFTTASDTPIPGLYGDSYRDGNALDGHVTFDAHAMDGGKIWGPDGFNMSWKFGEWATRDEGYRDHVLFMWRGRWVTEELACGGGFGSRFGIMFVGLSVDGGMWDTGCGAMERV
ncbi:hypothetical protein P280DRAFT_484825 [Massarina eburnea CBS 473.64]|uniref:Uncharacterized protein n=1 Tax=Massarina eburnea CBS 473.64 TaxID=1395130 RepID=A0A6A6RJ77_9PLEO|nr:hypothetical protein P280DRAFT_484825 [Massarina eburnea CBS 473.64]